MALTSKLTAIADAIRAKTGGTSALTLDGMAEAVKGIQTGGGGGGFPNGTEWTQSNVTSGYFYHVEYADRIWVACSCMSSFYSTDDGQGLWYSTDGMNWTQSNVTSKSFTTAMYADGAWVAIGNTSGIWHSADGMTWTNVVSQSANSYATAVLMHADGMWVAGYIGGKYSYYSSDGMTWSECVGIANGCVPLCHAKGMWFAGNRYASGLYYSTDGMNWTQSDATFAPESVSNINGELFACGKGIWRSSNGISWTQVSDAGISGWSNPGQKHVAKIKGTYVAATNRGLYYSTDGMNWTQSNVTSGAHHLYLVDGACFALSTSNMENYTSSDGKTWTRIGGGHAHLLVCANGLMHTFVSNTNYGPHVSTDGHTWTYVSRFPFTVYNGKNVCVADGMWVAASYGQGIYYSIAWQPSN